MLRNLTATESRETTLPISEYEAECLRLIGENLASRSNWWGSDNEQQRSVIKVISRNPESYDVTFRDVVGTIRAGDLQIRVLPKIPVNHFNYLIARSEIAPRVAKEMASVDRDPGLFEIIARWCVDEAEGLLKTGLRKDYELQQEHLPAIRGTLLTTDTALAVYSGVPLAACEFEELSDDAPLNRIVKSACEAISVAANISPMLRRSARSVAYRMGGIGKVRPSDLRVRVDRLTRSYSKVIPLSALILNGMGISTAHGGIKGTAFLIRTPELIEDGLRSCLRESINSINITKKGLMLGNTGLSVNPDLIFGSNTAIGDVKYKFINQDWSRADLNQIVTFATAFHSKKAALLGFVSEEDSPIPRTVPVGPVTAKAFGWIASPSVTPENSAAQLSSSIESWVKH